MGSLSILWALLALHTLYDRNMISMLVATCLNALFCVKFKPDSTFGRVVTGQRHLIRPGQRHTYQTFAVVVRISLWFVFAKMLWGKAPVKGMVEVKGSLRTRAPASLIRKGRTSLERHGNVVTKCGHIGRQTPQLPVWARWWQLALWRCAFISWFLRRGSHIRFQWIWQDFGTALNSRTKGELSNRIITLSGDRSKVRSLHFNIPLALH